MSKIDFINKFNSICDEMDLHLDHYFEYGVKISSDEVNTDRVNIIFKKEFISIEDLFVFINKIFNNENLNGFVHETFDKYKDKIKQIILGYSNGNNELYLEIAPPDESSYCYSYNVSTNKVNEYIPFDDHQKEIEEAINFLTSQSNKYQKPEHEYPFKGGWFKNNTVRYLISFEPLEDLLYLIKPLCEKTNPDKIDIINNWFDENKNSLLTHFGYVNENGKTIINLYIKK